ncbi:MAG: hypothetical protein ABMA15_04850 [Vicinamibacterales bacterium]
MPTKNIPTATIADVEAALIEQYGRTNIKEKNTTGTRAEWVFRITSKSRGKCTATQEPDGVTIAMSPYTHPLLWTITAIGYVLFIVPGLALTVFLLVGRFITARVIGYRLPKMVESVQRMTATRTGRSA